MAIFAKPSTFDLPAEGWSEGTVRHVRDLGQCDWADGKSMVELVFELDEMDSRGEPFEVSHAYNNSLNEAARLRIDLEAGLDRELTDHELAGNLDLEGLIGTRFGVRVGHRRSQRGGTFSDIKALRPAGDPKEKPPIAKQAGEVDDFDDDLPF
jgi:hypothetical protein